LVSDRFYPSVGGVETVTRLLGEAFVDLGHSVSLVTREKAPADFRLEAPALPPALPGELIPTFPFKVWRRPGMIRLLREYTTADAVIVQGLAARLAWPLLWVRKRAVMVHHLKPTARKNWMTERVRVKLARRARHMVVSCALAKALPWPMEAVVPNPYDDATFRLDPAVCRDRDIIFVGRLIPEKGAHVLVEALAILRRVGVACAATVAGDGPARERLMKLIESCELGAWVQVIGQVNGSALARVLNQHRVLVVPSVCHESFGIVALEGIACGCAVAGSQIGGLPEAIGPCGVTFPAGDAGALASQIQGLLHSPGAIKKLRDGATHHLAPHRPRAVAQSYLNLFAKYRLSAMELRLATQPTLRESDIRRTVSKPKCRA
jgi:glycogen(starch) synthase